MATNNHYPSYLPEDFRGLPSLPDGNRRLYYRQNEDGTRTLYGEVITKSRIVIRYPAGSTIEVIPANSVGSEEIKNGSVGKVDVDDEVKEGLDELNNIGIEDKDIEDIFFPDGDVPDDADTEQNG